MLNIASIDIDNIKDTPDCWVMIDILKAGYKEALNRKDSKSTLLVEYGEYYNQ